MMGVGIEFIGTNDGILCGIFNRTGNGIGCCVIASAINNANQGLNCLFMKV